MSKCVLAAPMSVHHMLLNPVRRIRGHSRWEQNLPPPLVDSWSSQHIARDIKRNASHQAASCLQFVQKQYWSSGVGNCRSILNISTQATHCNWEARTNATRALASHQNERLLESYCVMLIRNQWVWLNAHSFPNQAINYRQEEIPPGVYSIYNARNPNVQALND